MPDVPILSGPPQKLDGGREYAARLTTVDGENWYLCMNFNAPASQNGAVNLGAVKNFDPRANALHGIVGLLVQAQLAAFGRAPNGSPVVEVEGGTLIVLAHVVSFEFLGAVEARTDGGGLLHVRDSGGNRSTYRTMYPELGDVE